MGGQYGTKELQEALVGLFEVSLTIIEGFKDGVQLGDFTDFWAKYSEDTVFKQKLQEAYEGYEDIPKEAGELDISDIVNIISSLLPYIPQLIDALKPVETTE